MNFEFLVLYLFSIFLLLLCSSSSTYYDQDNIFDWNEEKSKFLTIRTRISYISIIVFFIVFSVGLMCATRSMMSYDTIVYVPWYEQIQKMSFFQHDGTYGLLFELFAKLTAKVFQADYHIFFFLIAAFNLIVVYKAMMKDWEQKNIAVISYLLYIVFLGFYYSFIVLRQGLAITFVIMAYSILEKSKKKALILCCIGFLFHESALIALFCIMFFYDSRIKFKETTLYILLIISCFFYITRSTTRFIIPILQSALQVLNRVDATTFHKYVLYFEEDVLSYDVSILFVLYYGISIILIYCIFRKHSYELLNEKNRFFITVNVLGLLIIGFFAAASTVNRLAEYLVSGTYIFLIPKCLNCVTNLRNTKIVIAIIMAVMTALHLRIILGPIDLFF